MDLIVFVSLGVGIIGGVILAMRSRNYDIALDMNISDKLRELPALFEVARDSIKIATDFDPKFFDNKKVKDAIERALVNGAKVQFLCEAEPVEWYKKKEGIEIRKVDKLSHHTMIIDAHHVRLEKPHEVLRFGEHKGDRALLFNSFPVLAKKYSGEFDALWTKCS